MRLKLEAINSYWKAWSKGQAQRRTNLRKSDLVVRSGNAETLPHFLRSRHLKLERLSLERSRPVI